MLRDEASSYLPRNLCMGRKTLLIILLAAAAIGAAAWYAQKSTPQPSGNRNSSGLIVSANAMYVADQGPGRVVSMGVVRLEQPGFVAMYEDANAAPGEFLGVSALLPAGESKSPTRITLSRVTTDGEVLYAALYVDDGDGTFDEATDAPALDSTVQEPVMMSFSVAADATEPAAVNL